MHPDPGRRILGVQRVGQPDEQVVVAEDAAAPLARFEFCDNGFGKADTDGRAGSGFGV